MKRQFKTSFTKIIFGATVLFALASSCKKKNSNNEDDPTPNGTSNKYFATFEIDNTDGQSRAYYAKTLGDLNQSGTVSVGNATQLAPASSGFFVQNNKQMYYLDYQNKNMTKCDADANGVVNKGASTVFNELTYLSLPSFWKSDVAFMPDCYGLKITIFNPSTMVKMGTIDLTQYNRAGEVTDFPTAGSTIGIQGIGEAHVRGNYMFAAIYYMNNSMQPAVNKAYIAVLDLNKVNVSGTGNKESIVKLLTDSRCNTLGSSGNAGSSFFITDEKNDIYALAHNYFGIGQTGQNPAIICIKNGTTEIDSTYFFDLHQATGQFTCGLEYHKNGNFITAVQDPSLLDQKNPYSAFTDPVYNFHIANLYTKTTTAISGFPITKGLRSYKSYFEGDKGYIPYLTKSSQALYEVDMSKKTASKKFESEGAPVIYKLQ